MLITKHNVCLANSLDDCTANNAVIYTGLDCANVPFIHNRLPELIARRRDISPLAKRIYADRFNHLFQVCWPAYRNAQRQMGSLKFTVPYTAFSTLVQRIGSQRRNIIKATQALERAGLFRVKRSSKPSHRCNRFTPLNHTVPGDAGLTPNHGLRKLPTNGSVPVQAHFNKVRHIPVPSFCSMIFTALLGNAQTASLDMLMYGLIARFARPLCFLSVNSLAHALGVDRRTAASSIERLIHKRLIGGTVTFNRVHFFLVAHPALAENSGEVERLTKMVTTAPPRELPELYIDDGSRDNEVLAVLEQPNEDGLVWSAATDEMFDATDDYPVD